MIGITVDRESKVPLYLQITSQIRDAILGGVFENGERLTPERRLAALLNVNRTTVVNAYRELASEGLVTGHVGRGTIVTYQRPSDGQETADAVHAAAAQAMSAGQGHNRGQLPWRHLLAPIVDFRYDSLILDASTVAARQDVIQFTTATPSPELYPVEQIDAILSEALETAGHELLQHTPSEGFAPLRDALARWMTDQSLASDLSVVFDPARILIASGSQQALYMTARALVEPGDLVAIESPTYLGAAQVFRVCGARLLSIPVDRDGMNVDLLSELITRRRPKLIYTLPSFQNPTGSVLAIERRHKLLELASRYQVPIIEDDPYGALRYEGTPLPTLAALDRARGGDRVIYLSTISKMLFPGFRIGWVSGPRPVLDRLAQIKQIVDLDTNALVQWAVWAFLSRGLLTEHLKRLRVAYPERLDRMVTGLERHAGDLIGIDRPQGGLYLWCRIADHLRVRDLLVESAREGVAFAPGEPFFIDEPSEAGRNTLRLNFTLPSLEQIDEGTERLGRALHRLSAQTDDDYKRDVGRRSVTPIV
ncbi:MAG: PLP-dependent aminotransferase family protein [Thermomicrobiales bacterium]